MQISDLLSGAVVETKAKSLTGPLFYSDKIIYSEDRDDGNWQPQYCRQQSVLNELSRVWVVGIAAGVIRMALAIIHTTGHLFAALFTFDKGHLFHAAKGGCEFLRGFIESIPVIGRKFAQYYVNDGMWWMIKIYNPNKPDGLDLHANRWQEFKQLRPTGYVVA